MHHRKRQDNPPHRRRQEMVFTPPPAPLKRPPQTDLRARLGQLDEWAFEALDDVAARITASMEPTTSMAELHLLGTRAQILPAMKATHRSVRRLVERQDMELSLDALPVARVQLERCFLALLIEDNPGRWHARYRKNAWKAYAEKFFRDQRILGSFEPYRAWFGPSGTGIGLLRKYAHEMDVSEDELQTLRRQVLGGEEDPRWKTWFIADMPTPGKCLQELADETLKGLALILYPYYNNLSHFSHGGLGGVMQGAIFRNEAPGQTNDERQRFWTSNVMEQTLPLSYVSLLLVATLFARPFLAEGQTRRRLLRAWRPYHSDGSPLGVAVWDAWAAGALGADQQEDGR